MITRFEAFYSSVYEINPGDCLEYSIVEGFKIKNRPGNLYHEIQPRRQSSVTCFFHYKSSKMIQNSETKKCRHCNKPINWENSVPVAELCDECFDKMMDEEDRQFSIYYSQNELCHKCKNKLESWIIEKGRAVCWPDCENPYGSIKIDFSNISF